jgi:hypothetical protein
MKLSVLILALLGFFFNLSTACLHLYGIFDYNDFLLTGIAVDNDVTVCWMHKEISVIPPPPDQPNYWDCINGYYAFMYWDMSTWAYSNPHGVFRVPIEVVANVDNVIYYDVYAYGCGKSLG